MQQSEFDRAVTAERRALYALRLVLLTADGNFLDQLWKYREAARATEAARVKFNGGHASRYMHRAFPEWEKAGQLPGDQAVTGEPTLPPGEVAPPPGDLLAAPQRRNWFGYLGRSELVGQVDALKLVGQVDDAVKDGGEIGSGRRDSPEAGALASSLRDADAAVHSPVSSDHAGVLGGAGTPGAPAATDVETNEVTVLVDEGERQPGSEPVIDEHAERRDQGLLVSDAPRFFQFGPAPHEAPPSSSASPGGADTRTRTGDLLITKAGATGEGERGGEGEGGQAEGDRSTAPAGAQVPRHLVGAAAAVEAWEGGAEPADLFFVDEGDRVVELTPAGRAHVAAVAHVG